jgi:hypothetical protein
MKTIGLVAAAFAGGWTVGAVIIAVVVAHKLTD